MIPQKLARILEYGPEKSKKTWWIGRAAELGFNVIHLCGDRQGWHIFNQLSESAQKKITIIDASDGFNDPHFASFFGWFLKGKPFWFNISSHKCSPMPRNNEEAYYKIDVNKLTNNDIIVLDSWTALARSVMMTTADKQNIDLFDADKPDWDFYGFEGRQLDYVMGQFAALPCHSVIIAHSYLREQRDKTGKKVIWTKTQPISSSGPHGGKLGSTEVSDILFFDLIGKNYMIDTSAEQGRVGGCRNVPPLKENWDVFTFEKYCSLANIDLPGEDSKEQTAFEFLAAGFELPGPASKPVLQVREGGGVSLASPSKAKPASLSSLMGKK